MITVKILKNLIYIHIESYELIKTIYAKKKWGKTEIGFSKSFVWFDPRHDRHVFDTALAGVHRYFYNKAYFKKIILECLNTIRPTFKFVNGYLYYIYH